MNDEENSTLKIIGNSPAMLFLLTTGYTADFQVILYFKILLTLLLNTSKRYYEIL